MRFLFRLQIEFLEKEEVGKKGDLSNISRQYRKSQMMLSFSLFYNISVIMSGINNYQNRFNLEIIPTFVPHFIFDLMFCILSNLMYVIYVLV